MPQHLDRRELFGRFLKPSSLVVTETIGPLSVHEIVKGQIITRRDAIKTSATIITGATLLITSGQAPDAQAQYSSWPHDSRKEWGPLDPTQGETLFAPDGALDIYDQTYGTRVRKYFEDYAKWALWESDEAKAILEYKKPDTRKYWGFCSAAAVANREIARLRALGLSQKVTTEIYKGPSHKFGILTAYHAGFSHFRPDLYDIQGNINHFIKHCRH